MRTKGRWISEGKGGAGRKRVLFVCVPARISSTWSAISTLGRCGQHVKREKEECIPFWRQRHVDGMVAGWPAEFVMIRGMYEALALVVGSVGRCVFMER